MVTHSKNKDRTFSINKDHQLILKDLSLPKSYAIKGKFVIDSKNRLIFLVNQSRAWKRQHHLSDKITFKGVWTLNRNHDLRIILNKKENRFKGKKITFRTQLLDYRDNTLLFTIKSKENRSIARIRLLKVRGDLHLDRYNRLTFIIKKPKRPDVLMFSGAWKLNRNQEIVYEYQKLKTKTKRKIVLKGFWGITSRNRLRYYLAGSNKEFLDFKVSCQSPSLHPSQRAIKYRLEVGAGKRKKKKVITLRGEWKIKRNLALEFIMKRICYGI